VKRLAIPVLTLLLAACPALRAASRPLNPDQAKILESVRASALQYTQKLPDFMCTQITHRDVTSLGNSTSSLTGIAGAGGLAMGIAGEMRSTPSLGDVIEERLTFIDQRENYAVVSVNGHKVSGVDPLEFQGAISTGEFGTDLHNIFDPRSGTVFAWERSGSLHGRRVDIFSFRVPARKGAMVVDRDSGREVVAGYTGRAFVDAVTLDVLRIEYRLDLSPDFPIRNAVTTIEYKPTAIAGRRYMLPFRSEVRMQSQTRQFINTIEFRGYHKFVVQSTVLYGSHNPQ